ncbi:dienelactone hydrolase family protein [Neptunicella marina]|uniref:Dienelactone hydrolase family protein n=1 Tax=Neptunicella marina TaxID=2125989 RepID=A0A8J6IVF5_9ALTE|nr:dienelactone hydrolase family protein [Neptunicella marina]
MIIVVADIFGYTNALQCIADSIDDDVVIVDPYQGRDMQFADEAQAYDYFSRNVGLARYLTELKCQVQQAGDNCQLVGFSMGASVTWCLSSDPQVTNIDKALGFYGSQIRHHADVEPEFPVRLIFPASEQHFSVPQLMQKLQRKALVQVAQCQYQHGFMNRYSAHFNGQGYDQYMQQIQSFVKS